MTSAATVQPPVEVAPGILRIESVLGPRPFAQYLLDGGERSLLVDVGTVATPGDVILPALTADGFDPATLDLILLSHADVDHVGGLAPIRAAAPRALTLAHALDAPWIEDHPTFLRERYGWYAGHDVDYDAETARWLRDALAPSAPPVDVRLAGGERLRLGPQLTVEVLHLPGHSPGHVGLWEPRSATAIVIDAVMGGGLIDGDGAIVQPPPYYDVAAYERTVRTLQALQPTRLLTAHYPVIEGADVERFLADTLAFVQRGREQVTALLLERGRITLREAFEVSNPVLGPFTAMPNELAGSLRAHLEELVACGRARPVAPAPDAPGGPPAWETTTRR